MEASLVLSLRCKDKPHRDFVHLMMSVDANRPLFEEDVAESERDWFNALEDIDSAEWVEKKGDHIIHAGWTIGGWDYEDDIQDIFAYLTAAGVEDVRVLIVGDECWYQLLWQKDGKLEKYDSWQGKELDVLFDEGEELMEVLDRLKL
jgi:hypothetical protein